MSKKAVAAIFFRKPTVGDMWNLERAPGTGPVGGGGQTYIDIPLGGSLSLDDLWNFLGTPAPADRENDPWPTIRITAATVGRPDQAAPLEFGPRQGNNRYKISNQARQRPDSERHPAWTAANGFPEAPNDVADRNDPRLPDPANLRVLVVKTVDGDYFATYLNEPTFPQTFPQGMGLERIFTSGQGVITFDRPASEEVPPVVFKILDAWRRKKNVLLYGPPGTGKTFIMRKIWKMLGEEAPIPALFLDPLSKETPFVVERNELPFPMPARRDWATFHQNYSYENFILAWRPDVVAGAQQLVPRAGVLLDAAISIDGNIAQEDAARKAAAVIFIDEVNRGNVSRIFGEFITFMDDDYRVDPSSPAPPDALPVPLMSLKVRPDGLTQEIERPVGNPVQLSWPWHFPENVFVLASMNSVDRAVAPLDTALSRRFERVEIPPDLDLLAEWLGVDKNRLLADEREEGAEEIETEGEEEGGEEETAVAGAAAGAALTANDTAWLLLYRLNYEMHLNLGSDFEIGHTYLRELTKQHTEDDRYRALSRVWDNSIYPQLKERFSNRPDEFNRLLRVDGKPKPPPGYLFTQRKTPPGVAPSAPGRKKVIEVASLSEAFESRPEDVKKTLRFLAGIS